jgi:hypothetical protein
MIHDLRRFTVASGRMAEFLNLHETIASPILARHLGVPEGYWTTMTGQLNQFVHLWRFEDLSDYERRYAALGNDQKWQLYVSKTLNEAAILVKQESTLLRQIDLAALYPASRNEGYR